MIGSGQTTGRIIGYARVSTDDRQDLALQTHALLEAGVPLELLFTDTVSGATADRPGLANLLNELRAGDTVLLWRLDRLGRSVRNLADLAHRLREAGVGIRSLTDGVDTTTSSGRLIYNMLGSVAEYEREIIRERVIAGMAAAKRAGIHVGRRSAMTVERTAEARRMLSDGRPARVVARVLQTSEASLYRALNRHPL